MSYKIIQIAAPGKYLDGRPRPKGKWVVGSSGPPPGYVACLVKAVANFAHHKIGDVWVEYEREC